ncbi:MAG TPA: hypothetical protein VFY23_12115 [Candidatus Limnocylindrales bacterium]|nr:hypothetical protein [Candidatus Limnocylindrales bacterium]
MIVFTRPRRGLFAAPAGILALAAMVAACSPGSADGQGVVSLATPAPSSAATPRPSMDAEEAFEAFEQCMKDNGVDMHIGVIEAPGGGVAIDGDDDGVSPAQGGSLQGGEPAKPLDGEELEKLEAAEEACRELLPSGVMGDPNATPDPAMVEQMLGFAKCMRDQGIDYPDPQFNGGGIVLDAGAFDPSSESFQRAQEACGSSLPGGPPFVVGGTGTDTAP